MSPVAERANRVSAGTAISAWVTSSSLRLDIESATRPPQAPASSIGRNWSAVVRPTAKALPVRVSTSHISATICIQLPLIETSWPANQRR